MNYVLFEEGDENDFYSHGFTERDYLILQSLGERFEQTIVVSFVEEDTIAFISTWELAEPILKVFGPAHITPMYTDMMLTYKV